MPKLTLFLLGLLLSPCLYAENIWLDNSINIVPENKATLYMKEPPIQQKDGLWFTEIYDTGNNALRITAELTDPDVTKRKFVDNKFTFYCSSTCRQERKIIDDQTVEVWDYFSSGELYRHFFIIKDQVEGTMEIFYGAPTPMRTEEYRQGQKNGIERGFRNGHIYSATPYTDGKIDGLKQEWNDDDLLIRQVSYKDGKREGVEQHWNNQGQLIEEVNYKNDVLDGRYMRWNATGIPIEVGNYQQGKKQGEFRYYLDTGRLIKKEVFELGSYIGLQEVYNQWGPPWYLMESKFYDEQHRLVEELFYDEHNVLYRKKKTDYQTDTIVSIDTDYENKQIHSQTTEISNLKNNAITTVYEKFDDKQRLIAKSESLNDQYHGVVMRQNYYGEQEVLNYQHGKLHGEALITDSNGNIVEKGRYDQGVMVGLWQKTGYFNNQATLVSEGYNSEGKLNGSYIEKDTTGQIITSGKYVNGKKVGTWIEHRGLNKLSINYNAKGELHGHFSVMNTKGNIVEEGYYQHGELNGRYIEKDDMGNTISEENYLNGKRHGQLTIWLAKKIVTQGQYQDDEKYGYWLEYGSNHFAGRTDICKGNYQQGRKVDKWKCFSPAEYLTTSIFFDSKGLLQGNGYYFTQNGMLQEVAHYQDGLLEGIDKIYDEKGQESIYYYEKGNQLPDQE